MKILSENKKEIWLKLPCGTKTVIDKKDKWIIKEFPSWIMGGCARSRYVCVQRFVKTEYSSIRERISLSRVIVKPRGQEQVDHKDRDRLNNRRSNLRICSRSQNSANASPLRSKKYKGVYLIDKATRSKPYRCYISSKKRGLTKNYLKTFKTEIEAARDYDRVAKKLWGEFAYLNFPNG